MSFLAQYQGSQSYCERKHQVNSTPLEIHLLNGEQYTCIMNDALLCTRYALETMVS